MPGKSANVKNEKQYEALKDKGMSKERAAKIANSPGASNRGGKKSHSGSAGHVLPGRDDRAEEGGRPQGREGDRPQELLKLEGREKPAPTGFSPAAHRGVSESRSSHASVDRPGRVMAVDDHDFRLWVKTGSEELPARKYHAS